jgi:hypothetical protein
VIYSLAILGKGSVMMKIHQAGQEGILKKIREGRIDGAAVSVENFIDTIIKKMKELGVIDELKHIVTDKRADNARIPLELLWALGITAKMKVKTGMTDILIANRRRGITSGVRLYPQRSGMGIGDGIDG